MKNFIKTNIYYIFAALILLAASGFLAWKFYPSTLNIVSRPFSVILRGGEGSQDTSAKQKDAGNQAYVHQNPSFSFDYPKGFNVGNIAEEEGETVLVQKDGKGFQIYFSFLGEDLEITPEKIKTDIPDMPVDNPSFMDIDGIRALVFDSRTEGGGENTRETWFNKDGYLYQLTAEKEYADVAEEVLGAWRWQ